LSPPAQNSTVPEFVKKVKDEIGKLPENVQMVHRAIQPRQLKFWQHILIRQIIYERKSVKSNNKAIAWTWPFSPGWAFCAIYLML
jgi:hypothetical protein